MSEISADAKKILRIYIFKAFWEDDAGRLYIYPNSGNQGLSALDFLH